MTSLLDNLDSSDSDDINRLFPRCRRPQVITTRADINLNTLRDDNDNRVLVIGMGDSLPTSTPSPAPPSPAPTIATPTSVIADVMLEPLNGLCERRDDEEADEEDDEEEEQEETPSGSQCEDGGSPPSVSQDDVPLSGYRKYKHLRDSRIEIAGGREVFSQSKSKAARKRFSEDGLGVAAAAAAAVGTVGSLMANAGPRRSEDKAGVWELRGARPEPLKRVRSVPAPPPPDPADMVTETVFSTEVRSIRRVSDSRFRQAPATAPVVYEAPSAGVAEVVVFDDIGECLVEQHHRGAQVQRHAPGGSGAEEDSASGGSSSTGRGSPPPVFHRPPADFFKVVGPSGSDVDTDPMSPERSRAPRVIGGLPIAEYEGSPRRYGPRQPESPVAAVHGASGLPSAQSLLSSPSMFPPRPGFPQRVLTQQQQQQQEEQRPSSPPQQQQQPLARVNNPTDPAAYDYLYEFSETRKVLEEFFKPSSPTQQLPEISNEFSELEYDLRRQAGNSYVGQRLAKDGSSPGAETGVVEEEIAGGTSPRITLKPGGTPDLISLRDHEDTTLVAPPVTLNNHHPHHQSFLASDHDVMSNNVEEDLAETEVGLQVGHSRNFTLSPETTDCDSNDIESEVSLENEGSLHSSGGGRLYGSMPVLEDGLSSGHASDAEDVSPPDANPTVLLMKKQICEIEREIRSRAHKPEATPAPKAPVVPPQIDYRAVEDFLRGHDANFDSANADLDPLAGTQETPPPPAPQPHRSELSHQQQQQQQDSSSPPPESVEAAIKDIRMALQMTKALPLRSPSAADRPEEDEASPVWVPRQPSQTMTITARVLPEPERKQLAGPSSDDACDEEELDTDLETDRLLGQQRTDDQGFFDDKEWRRPTLRSVLPATKSASASKHQPPPSAAPVLQTCSNGGSSASGLPPASAPTNSDKPPSPQKSAPPVVKSKKDKESIKKKSRNKEALLRDPSVLIEGVLFRARYLGSTQLVCEGQPTKSTRMMQAEEAVSRIKANQNCSPNSRGYGLDESEDEIEEMDQDEGLVEEVEGIQEQEEAQEEGEEDEEDEEDEEEGEGDEEEEEGTLEGASSEVARVRKPTVKAATLSPGSCGATAFRLQFLGSVEVEEEGKKHRKRLKKNMVEEAVAKVKAPEGENQPSTEVDLFISTEKIMVLNTDLKEIMMDHALRTISYIADIGDLVVLMARRRYVPQDVEEAPKVNRTPKMICHVFESEEAQFIAQSIGQAFQVAYMEFLKANGIEDHSFVKEMDYQEVLNSQEIFGDELQMFAKKEMQKEVVVPKAKGEILGVVIVESGWGSMLPTVVIANLAPAGAAARCGQLNIGDQIIAINGVSLVGLPLSTCQNYIKNTKNQTVVKLTVVPCAPVVEVKIKRPDTKYQLGFSVQNGVICSLLRGGIAERGGVRVGHRIIEINNQSVVAVPHEKIVNLLATSVGEILMKTMPTSMFRLLTGQETPLYI